MKVLLGSETLQLRSENDVYYLLCAWLSQSQRFSDEQERCALFVQLLPLLRFYHMSQDFLCSVVSACPYANAASLLPYIMRCSHARRTEPSSLSKEDREDAKMGSKDRSKGTLQGTYRFMINLADLLPLAKVPSKSMSVYEHIGLEWGFPVAVYVKHKGTVGLFVNVGMPSWQGAYVVGGIERHAGFEFDMELEE